MIFAVLRGKLSCLRAEDPLTAAVFGRLRYLPWTVLVEWLSCAASADRARTTVDWPRSAPSVEFWPSWSDVLRGQGTVEPDVVLEWEGFHAVIEAKLWSGKSAAWREEAESYLPADQLARQWEAALHREKNERSFAPRALVYLTRHMSMPEAELMISLGALRNRGFQDVPLYWLSWSSLERPLRRVVDAGTSPCSTIAVDLLAYLDAADVLRFHGWRIGPAGSSRGVWTYSEGLAAPYFARFAVPRGTWCYDTSMERNFAL